MSIKFSAHLYDKIYGMADKTRTFEKAKSKRASHQKKIDNINLDSSMEEVDEFLKDRYGYGIWNFIYSLYWVAATYNMRDISKEIDLLKTKARRLKTAKNRLLENIDHFLIDTDIWKIIKRSYPDLNIKWTAVKREKFIADNFNIDNFFKIVDDYTKKLNNRIKFLDLYCRIPAGKLRIKPRNLVILVWSHVMREQKKEDTIEFENISMLLNWFSLNKNFADFFKSTKLISPRTPELTYNKYIKFAKDEEYNSLSFYLYIDFFPDISEPLIEMYPNPINLVKQEIEGKKIMAKKRFEK